MTPPTLKQIIEKATPGVWSPDICDDGSWRMYATYGLNSRPCVVASRNDWSRNKEQSHANAQLIARCSPSVMLAVVEALENAISIMRADAKQFREQSDGRMAMASDAAAERWETALNALNGKAP